MPDPQPVTPVMTSRQKVMAMIAHAEALDVGADPQLQALLLGITMMRGQIVGLIPDDPEQLDNVLTQGAMWALKLRSDHALELVVAPAAWVHEPTVAEEDEPDA